MTVIEPGAINKLTPEEAEVLKRTVQRCCEEPDLLIRRIGGVYLQGMCDMLRVQGQLSEKEAKQLINQVKA